MAARGVAIAMLLVMLGVIGMFLWPIIRPPEAVPVASLVPPTAVLPMLDMAFPKVMTQRKSWRPE